MGKARLSVTMLAWSGLLISAPLQAQTDDSRHHEAIRRVFERDFADSWREADSESIANLWTDDGDWSSVIGSRRLVRGRVALEEVWAIGLEGRTTPEELAIEVDVDHVRLLGGAHAVVDIVMTFAADTENAAREAYVMVMTHEGDRWLIASARAARLS